jgi:lipoate-protein ligase A
MAIDEAIVNTLASGEGQPTLRFYQWEPACLSLGCNQHFTDVDEAACQALGYTWVRRLTGGRAILHTDELTYSVVTTGDDPRVQGGIVPSYRALSRGLLAGLQVLGAVAVQAKGDMPKNPNQGAACFDTPSHYEVTLNGKKLVGSAQARRKGMVLQHGTLPLSGDITRIFDVLALDEAEKPELRRQLVERATTLEAELGEAISFERAAEAMAQGFAQMLNLKLEPGSLTDQETTLVAQLRTDTYLSDAWNKRF